MTVNENCQKSRLASDVPPSCAPPSGAAISLCGDRPKPGKIGGMHFLVFQHHESEHPGSLRAFWRRDGISWDTVALAQNEPIPASLVPYDALVVMGGAMDVWQEDQFPWLVAEKAAIRHFVVELDRPFLGLCLGHQLLAAALGGVVGPSPRPEVGITDVDLTGFGRDDPLFATLPDPLQTFQWHGAEVSRLPAGAVLLAANAVCGCQAFRWRRAYGLQFHAEITDDTVADWQAIPEYRAYLQSVLGPQGDRQLAQSTLAALPSLQAIAARVHRNFMGLVDQVLDSRG